MSFFSEVMENGLTFFQNIIVFILFLVFLRLIIRNIRTYRIIVACIFLVGALPLGILIEISVNSCCGAPTTGKEGVGFTLTGIMFVFGLILMINTLSKNKKVLVGLSFILSILSAWFLLIVIA